MEVPGWDEAGDSGPAPPTIDMAGGCQCSMHGYEHGHSTRQEGPDLALVPQSSRGPARGLGLTCSLYLRDHIKPWGPRAWGTRVTCDQQPSPLPPRQEPCMHPWVKEGVQGRGTGSTSQTGLRRSNRAQRKVPRVEITVQRRTHPRVSLHGPQDEGARLGGRLVMAHSPLHPPSSSAPPQHPIPPGTHHPGSAAC